MAELEVTYRHCLLESQKARDAVDALLEQLHEEMGVTDPRELVGYAANGYKVAEAPDESGTAEGEPEILSQEEEAQLRKLRRRVDSLRSRLKALGGSDPDAPPQYEETANPSEVLTHPIDAMGQAAFR